MISRFSLLLMIMALAGCDRISGLRTDAKFSRSVDIRCVDRSLRRVTGAGTISRLTDQSETFQVMPYRGRIITVSNHWQYGVDRKAIVQIIDDGQQRTYFNGMVKMGEPWPAIDLDNFSPLMNRVNLALEEQCDLPIIDKGHISRT